MTVFLQTVKDVDLFELQSRRNYAADKDVLTFPGISQVRIQATRVRSMLEDLVRNGASFLKLSDVANRIASDGKLEAHLDQVLGFDMRLISNVDELEQAIESYKLAALAEANPLSPEAPWNFEGLFSEYQKFGTEEMRLLMAVILPEKEGGQGYRLKRSGISASRWDMDHQTKTIYLPQNEFALLWTFRTNRSVAETLRDALHEEFKGEESIGSAIQRIGGGAIMLIGGSGEVIAGVAGLMVPEPTMATKAAGVSLLALGSSTFVEGATQIFHPKQGRGFNPLEEGVAYVGRGIAGEKGDSIARGGFIATNLIVSVGSTVKISRALKTEAGVLKQMDNMYQEIVDAKKAESAVETANEVTQSVPKGSPKRPKPSQPLSKTSGSGKTKLTKQAKAALAQEKSLEAQILQRKKLLQKWYRNFPSISRNRLKMASHIEGTDLTKPVFKRKMKPGEIIDQHRRLLGQNGIYGAYPGASASEVAVDPHLRIRKKFMVTKEFTVVESTAAPFESGKVAGVGGKGLGQQLILPPDWERYVIEVQ